LLFFAFTAMNAISQVCCPKFELKTSIPSVCNDLDLKECDSNAVGRIESLRACKNQPHQYLVVPNNPLIYSYHWHVTGGTVVNAAANPATINWGNSSQGILQVIIENADGSGSCRDTINRKICLMDSPTAAITFYPNSVCKNTTINFSGMALGGVTNFYWDFGDGNSSNLQNPTHSYASGGDHQVVLTVSNINREGIECGCRDTAMVIVHVNVNEGIDIHSCEKMLCTGDTVTYHTSTTGCTGLNWSVSGGTILGPHGVDSVVVIWNQPGTYPTSVTLNASCPNTCGNSATLNVPVLYPNLPIQGPSIVCQLSNSTYSLPALPGTIYEWTVTGGGNIIGPNHNVNFIKVNWTSSSGIIKCFYNNPYTGCMGSSTLQVNIKPKFTITGIPPICSGSTTVIVDGGVPANWTINPLTGYTPGGNFNAVPSISPTWNQAGNYSITATSVTAGSYCTDEASINLVVNPKPVLNSITGDSIVCPNQIYNYSVSSNISGGNFAWNLTGGGTIAPYGNANSNISVNFTGSGPWTLEATQTVNGCIGSKILPITKVPPPPTISIMPTGNICSGVTITTSVTGSVPSGGYIWTSSPGAVLIGGQGTTHATFILNDHATIKISSCGESNSISVNPTPATVDIQSTAVTSCSATLNASPGGGIYQWFLNGNPLGTGNPIIITQNGSYIVQATYPGGCIATSPIKSITGITPVIASISGTGSLCNNGVVNLQALVNAVCPNATFTWSNGAIGNTINVTTPGNYYVKVNCSNGCSAVSNILIVSPCPLTPGTCFNDLIITGNNSCSNPINLSASVTGCVPSSTTWYYGDGTSGPSGIHQYTNAGTYTLYAVMACSNGTYHCTTQNVTIPMVADFTSVVSCISNGWSIQLQDASLYLPTYAGYTISWTTTCGTLSSPNISNPLLTVPFGCDPTVKLTISKNGCILHKSFSFNFPSTSLNIIGPANVCKGDISSFSSSNTAGVLSYSWNFGNGTTGITNPIQHAYSGTPTNPIILLGITDQNGCLFNTTKTVTVVTPRPLIIKPSSILKICSDCTQPVILSINTVLPQTGTTPSQIVAVNGFSNFQWFHNGTAINGATNSNYTLCTFDASGNYYVTANDNLYNNCLVISDTVEVVYQPKPVAEIIGPTVQCNTGNISLHNSVSNPNYTYLWMVNPITPISPNDTSSMISCNLQNAGTYQFILTVTDRTTHCTAIDTFCVYVYNRPSVSITSTGNLCEGSNSTFTAHASPANPNYIYFWNNDVIGSTMTTSQPGYYDVSVADPLSGCFGTANYGVNIRKKPYVDLFPLGCDTLCDTVTIKIDPPLPLKDPPQTNSSVYTIQWFDGTQPISTDPVLNLSGLAPGPHSIYIVANFINDSCSSTSGTYDLFIKHCGNCSCTGHNWGRIVTSFGSFNGFPECNLTYHPLCNQTVNFDASFNCGQPNCQSRVTYALHSPGGITTTGQMPLSFVAYQTGTYTLKTYGWCGTAKCDSCIYYYKVECQPPPCCPQASEIVIKNIASGLSQQTYQGNSYSVFTNSVSISAGTTPFTEVRADIVDFQLTANYGKCIDCTNLPFTWASLSASIFDGIEPATSGVLPSVGYTVPSNSYCNPREVVWNNGATMDLSTPQSTKLSLFLPPLNGIPCCVLKAKVCLKFSFKDINCNLCEKDTCYEITLSDTIQTCKCDSWINGPIRIFGIKNNNGSNSNVNNPSVRDSKPHDDPSAGFPINCRESITLSKGEYRITAPGFNCSSTMCAATYNWTVRGGSNVAHINGHGNGNPFNFNFTIPGNYSVSITPECGTAGCSPCTFSVVIQ